MYSFTREACLEPPGSRAQQRMTRSVVFAGSVVPFMKIMNATTPDPLHPRTFAPVEFLPEQG